MLILWNVIDMTQERLFARDANTDARGYFLQNLPFFAEVRCIVYLLLHL